LCFSVHNAYLSPLCVGRRAAAAAAAAAEHDEAEVAHRVRIAKSAAIQEP
jgi:hypothetical protein